MNNSYSEEVLPEFITRKRLSLNTKKSPPGNDRNTNFNKVKYEKVARDKVFGFVKISSFIDGKQIG